MTRLSLTTADHALPAPEWSVESWMNAASTPSLAAYRGRVIALHAFQMLCPGCVVHGIPQAQRIQAAFDPHDVAVVGLHTVFEHHDAMRPVSLRAFLHEYRVSFPVGIDAAATGSPIPTTMSAYGMRGTPSLVLIDAAGRVRLQAFGRPDDMEVGAAIATLVAEARGGREVRNFVSAADESSASPSAGSVSCDESGCPVDA